MKEFRKFNLIFPFIYHVFFKFFVVLHKMKYLNIYLDKGS